MDVAYSSEDCQTFSVALNHAWEIFLKAQGLTPNNFDTAKAALTYAILHSAREGERNPRKLARAAVAHMEQFHPGIQMARAYRVQELR
jgi:hypothetical protein